MTDEPKIEFVSAHEKIYDAIRSNQMNLHEWELWQEEQAARAYSDGYDHGWHDCSREGAVRG